MYELMGAFEDVLVLGIHNILVNTHLYCERAET